MPFPVRAIQVDGGSEFEAIFEEECQKRDIKLFVLPPRSPKLNGAVERAHRTHTEEFYEVTESSFGLAELRDELLEWEQVHNTVRLHQALGLTWRDVDLDISSPKISVRRTAYKLDSGEWRFEEPKTDRSRRDIPLPVSLVLLLMRLREQKQANAKWCGTEFSEDDFVFSNPDKTPLNPNTVTHTFAKLVERAGMRLRLHDLRHIHATMLLKAGVHPRIVQERLGHSSIATTLDIYSHTVPGLQKAAAERIDALLPKMVQEENVGRGGRGRV